MNLRKVFGLYTISFVGVTLLIGIAEWAFDLPNRWIGWLFMALSMGIYVVIGIVTRTSEADQYGTTTVASGVFGIPLGFITIWIVSALTKAPPQEIQDLVTEIRYPKSGGAAPAVNAKKVVPAPAR